MVERPTLFDGARASMRDSIDATLASLQAYGPRHKRWAIAWSGGKDSTATLTVVLWLLLSKRLNPPEVLHVYYADTRMELPPLWITAQAIREELLEHAEALAALGCRLDVQTVMAPIEKRFWPYMLGRGVPPPNNGNLRWCTRQIKVQPMHDVLEALCGGDAEPALMITGVRLGESAARDGRIALSCSKDGGECGQGWYQQALPSALCATLAPLLHWRICHVWQWLDGWAPLPEYGEWSTRLLALAYGGRDGDEAAEINARTGCICCPLASRDSALLALVRRQEWAYLAPLLELRALWDEMRSPLIRLRQPPGETRKDGSPAANQNRMGPLTIEGRRRITAKVLDIQARINADADRLGRPRIDLLDAAELAYIEQAWAANLWPEGWDGSEPGAWLPFEDRGQLYFFDVLARGAPSKESEGSEASLFGE